MTGPAALTSDEAFARIRLLRSAHIGPTTYHQLLARCGSARAALAALPDLAGKGRGRYSTAPEGAISAEVAAVKKAGARYLFHDTPDYPPMLRALEGAPPILIARGNPALARAAPVAMVGARNASAGAMRFAREFAQALAARGHAVVSGLARGIDTAAHRGALEGGAGGTIAVIACGIDIAYPPENAALQEHIWRNGLLLTELPPGTEPNQRQFPARNRIIAGLALGTLVVEAAPGSGSLITARLAADYGREVMAVPGSPLDPRSRGCNALIRDGAVLVQDVDDVIELITGFAGAERLMLPAGRLAEAPAPARPAPALPEPPAPARPALGPAAAPMPGVEVGRAVAALLSHAPVAVDELVRQSGAGAADVQMALIELELAGRITRHAGGKVSLAG